MGACGPSSHPRGGRLASARQTLRGRRDDVTDEVVGIMIGQFRQAVVARHPGWEGVVTKTGKARRVALRRLVAEVAAMPVDDDSPADDVSQ